MRNDHLNSIFSSLTAKMLAKMDGAALAQIQTATREQFFAFCAQKTFSSLEQSKCKLYVLLPKVRFSKVMRCAYHRQCANLTDIDRLE